jgi:hypothetical protein
MLKKIIASAMLMPAMTLGLYAAPALGWFSSDDLTVKVKNSNSASVSNYVTSVAATGGNLSQGGAGGGAGDGGDVKWTDDDNNGGNGGNAGDGGDSDVITGDATSKVLVANDVNYNKTKVSSSCDCEEADGDTLLKVKNYNHANVGNSVGAGADTGLNASFGGNSGSCDCPSAGDGGDVKGSDDNNDGGDGGDAGDGGYGFIHSGDAYAKAKVFNKVNTSVTRIRR